MAESANIPVIDIASGRPEGEVAKELVDAAVEFGFIYVKCGGMDVKAIERAFELVSFVPSHIVFWLSTALRLLSAGGMYGYWMKVSLLVGKGLRLGVAG